MARRETRPDSPHVIAFFKEEVRPEADGPEYELTMVRWASAEALAAWRNHPEHLKAQKRGREFFYQSYSVLECSVIREIEFERD